MVAEGIELGIKTTATLASRLVRASQITGQPVPELGRGSTAPRKRVDTVEVRRRGRGDGFGVNIPQETLERLGIQAGDHLTVVVAKRGRIQPLRVAGLDEKERASREPRLVKRRGR